MYGIRSVKGGALLLGKTLAVVVVLAAFVTVADPVWATTFEVTNANDSGDGSLRDAITDANAAAGADTIEFASDVTGEINLVSALPNLSTEIEIKGPGADELTVRRSDASGTPNFRIFTVTSSGTVFISGLTISNGNSAINGGGIYNTSGTLNVTDSTLSDNSAINGGGIANSGSGTLNVTNSTLSDNSASNSGGGIYNAERQGAATLNVTNSTLSDNSALNGGGIYHGYGTANISSGTLSGNSASTDGGGIYNNSGTVNARNSIVAGNTVGGDTAGNALTDGGYNFIGGDPELGELQDNGGPTKTRVPLDGSPVIDGGNSFGLTTDQRGQERTHDDPAIANAGGGDGSDIGAVERHPITVTNTSDSGAGSLRDAITDANDETANPGKDTITFAPALSGQSISLSTAGGEYKFGDTSYGSYALAVSSEISIEGGESGVTIARSTASATPDMRLFYVQGSSADLTLSNLTLSNGKSYIGGAILNDAGVLALTDSTVSSNDASEDGGGIFNYRGTTTLTDSTLSSNSASGYGGAVYNFPGSTLTLTNSTLSGNSGSGGGIFNDGTTTLTSSTIHANKGVGVVSSSGTVESGNTIITGNNAPNAPRPDVRGPFSSQGHNLIGDKGGDSSGFTDGKKGDQVGTSKSPLDPKLGPLQDNGGPTKTLEPLPGSPAIEAGDNSLAASLDFDQRGDGYPRKRYAAVDVGAFELQVGHPEITLPGSTIDYTENDPATVLDSDTTLTDIDAPQSFDGGQLTVSFSKNGEADDRLEVRNEGNGTGEIGVTGGSITYGGTAIGTLSGGAGTQPLKIGLNSNATLEATQALVRAVTYHSASETPSTAAREVSFVLSDGQGGTSAPGTKTVNVTTTSDTYEINSVEDETDAEGCDATDCTLREAVEKANGDPAQDDITFAPELSGETISLFTVGGKHTVGDYPDSSYALAVSSPVVIKGPATTGGESEVTIARSTAEGTPQMGLFLVNGGVEDEDGEWIRDQADLSLRNLTLSNGQTHNGGAILNYAGKLTLTDTTVSSNSSSAGGGIYNHFGTLTLTNSTVSDNFSSGGGAGIHDRRGTLTLTDSTVSSNHRGQGILTDGWLTLTNSAVNSNDKGGISLLEGIATLTDSTVSGNSGNEGAGINNGAGTVTLTNSTVSDNSTSDSGGGIFTFVGYTTLINSTVSGNSAHLGGGIYNAYTEVTLTNSTLTGNSATRWGGGVFNEGGAVRPGNTIIAGNNAKETGSDVYTKDSNKPFSSNGHNLIGIKDGSTGFTDDQEGDQVGTGASPLDPKLGPLQDNGGPTETHKLLPGSPAIDAGDDSLAASFSTDQRGDGYPRKQGAAVDTGAFEVQPNKAPVVDATEDVSTDEDKAKLIELSATDADNAPLSYKLTSLPSHGILYEGDGTEGADEITTASAEAPHELASSTDEVTYVPDADYNGDDSFTYKANDGTADSDTATVAISVAQVNDVPSFQKGADPSVDENAGAQEVSGWATSIEPGPENESDQNVSFEITANSNPGLFARAPSVAPDGKLTYEPARNTSGEATIKVRLKDDGGTDRGGVDTSAEQEFKISVNKTPTISIEDTAVTEGDTGTKNATFTLTLSKASKQAIAVNYATSDATAKAGSDYEAVSNGTLTIPAGSTRGTATVKVNGDTTDEPDETFLLSLSNPQNATISDGSATATITDNDTPPPDTTAPTVSSTTPASDAKNVPLSTTSITATFSEKMKASTLSTSTVKLERIKGKGKKAKATAVPLSQVSLGSDGKTLIIKPGAALAKKGVYKVTITTGATDEAGNALTSAKVWPFTMAKKK